MVEGQGVRRQPIWIDHELALRRRAAHAATQGVASVCNCLAASYRKSTRPC